MNLAIDTINMMTKNELLPQTIGTKDYMKGKKSTSSNQYGRSQKKQINASVEVHGLQTPSRLNLSLQGS